MSTHTTTVASLRQDLIDEHDALDSIVSMIPEPAWSLPTASERWTVADQIAHLAYFDQTAAWAIDEPKRFQASLADLAPVFEPDAGPETMDELTLGRFRAMSASELLDVWRAHRRELTNAAATLPEQMRVPWYGPSMGAKSFLTARLMECWAHGQHIADAAAAERAPTDRLRHIAKLGFITRKWTYVNRGLDAPGSDVGVELAAPSGGSWMFGPEDAEQSVTGSAEDFCLVVTQCRHVDATDLDVTGDDARDWMTKAQAFAGAATEGPSA